MNYKVEEELKNLSNTYELENDTLSVNPIALEEQNQRFLFEISISGKEKPNTTESSEKTEEIISQNTENIME